MANIFDAQNVLSGDDPDRKKAQELKLQRRIVFGITPSDEDRFESHIGADLSDGLKRKLMEVIDQSAHTQLRKRQLKGHIIQKSALSMA